MSDSKTFELKVKTVNKHGGASYKAVDDRHAGTIYCSPSMFVGEPPATITITGVGLADLPVDKSAEREAKKAAREAEKKAKAEAREAKKAEKQAAKEAREAEKQAKKEAAEKAKAEAAEKAKAAEAKTEKPEAPKAEAKPAPAPAPKKVGR